MAILDRTLEELEVETRTFNFLKTAGFNIVADVFEMTNADFKKKGIWRPMIRDLDNALSKLGVIRPSVVLEWFKALDDLLGPKSTSRRIH